MWMYRFKIPCLKKNVCSACEFKGTAVGWEALVHAGLPSDGRALTRTRADPRDRGGPALEERAARWGGQSRRAERLSRRGGGLFSCGEAGGRRGRVRRVPKLRRPEGVEERE